MLVRPIGPSDEDAYRAILETTTAEDRYCRFFHLVDHFDPDEIHRFVQATDEMTGVIALEGDVPLGAAHGVRIDAGSAELAVVVSREARRAGVGAALIDGLIEHLRARGYRRLIACSLRENHPFDRLARRSGFTIERAEGATFRWVLTFDAGEAATAP